MSPPDDPAKPGRGRKKKDGNPQPAAPVETPEEKAAAAARARELYEPICERWRSQWPAALQAWSAFTQIRDPSLWFLPDDLRREGVDGTLASIRLFDQVVQVNLPLVRHYGLEDFGLEFLAHEIGHHVFTPGNLADQARCMYAMKQALFGISIDVVQRTTNLYQDLLINDRLVRSSGLDLAAIYERLNQRDAGQPSSGVWTVYMRTYEHLWRCPPGRLAPPGVSEEMNGDAALLARLIRHYAGDWLRGSKRFATVMYPYIIEDKKNCSPEVFTIYGMNDCAGAARCPEGLDGVPDGLLVVQDSEQDDGMGFDDLLGGGNFPQSDRDAKGGRTAAAPPRPGSKEASTGQHREPFQFREILAGLGINLDQHAVTTRYYRERSLPHLIPFPQRRSPRVFDPLPEGYDSWDAGEDIQDLDLFGSLMRSPRLVPGVTTVQRVYGDAPGHEPARVPVDLDIYVDCSGSMPDPSVNISYLALAGTILTLSALRAGARVQATLWAGPRQFETSGGFLRDEKKLMGIVTGYINGSTAFPLHILRETYANRSPSSPPVHIVVISDEGVDTILQPDERKTPGEDLCRTALDMARGGATLVLNLPRRKWDAEEKLLGLGFGIHRVTDWPDLVAFARRFVRDNYPSD